MTDKVNAIVGLAKCPSSGKLYGVRIEIDGKKWTATWAFPISEEVAKREGYTQNVFPSDLKYSSRYPVCPYCGKREDLAAISQPKRQPPKIAVSSANFDDIGKILKTLGIKFLPYQYCKFDCDLLFLNCGTNDSVNIAGLRDFVDKGGCVYASDLTDSIITAAFPGYFKFRGHVGEVCKIYADVVDEELRSIVGNRIRIEFDMSIWAVLESSKGQTLLKGSTGGRYAGLPIMVRLKYGKGTIFYTCFHNHAQASEQEQALLQLLVLKQIGSNSNRSIEETGSDLGIDIDKIKAKFRTNW